MQIKVLSLGFSDCVSGETLEFLGDLKSVGFNVTLVTAFNNLSDFIYEVKQINQNAVLYINQTIYAQALKELGLNFSLNGEEFKVNDSLVSIVVNGINYYNFFEKLQGRLNEVDTFKLYVENKDALKAFLDVSGVKYSLSCDLDDVCLKFDFTGFEDKKHQIISDFIYKFKDYIYAETDVSLEMQLYKILKLRNLKISVAESFTGGNISSRITKISGASQVFYEGLVTYSEESKNKRLGVEKTTLASKKPVSPETAGEMVKGLLFSGVDLAISTTGIAGPNSDNSNYPVGLCYIGIGSSRLVTVYKYIFSGTRAEIIRRGTDTALFLAISALRSGKYDI